MDTVKAMEIVTQASADAEVRICRRMEIGSVVQQGDVYAHRVSDDHPRGVPLGTRQVAVGANVGARHVAEGDDVELFAGVELPPGVAVPEWATMEDMLGPVVVARGNWRFAHPEHAHHVLPSGTYQITNQLDFRTRRRVAD